MLDYFALGMLLLSVTAIFYIFIFIHDLPHRMAKKRNHPQVDAIHYACWLSLFTLHALWPLVFMWAVSNRAPLEVAVGAQGEAEVSDEIIQLRSSIAALESRLASIENTSERVSDTEA